MKKSKLKVILNVTVDSDVKSKIESLTKPNDGYSASRVANNILRKALKLDKKKDDEK